MLYRRAKQLGGTYFFTINLQNRGSTLLCDKFDILREAMNKTKKSQPFILDAMIVMPDHLHLLMTLPENDDRYAIRIASIKGNFSRNIPKTESISDSRKKRSERGIWQRRFWEHLIRDEDDYNNHVNYIHNNPVKHGLVENAQDWQYSSIHRFIEQGKLPENWGRDIQVDDNIDYGERK